MCYVAGKVLARGYEIISQYYNPGLLITNKMSSNGYKNPHYKPKMIWRPSQVTNGNPYSNKTVST